jgi:phosphoribosyl-AMP cyclohydrolase
MASVPTTPVPATSATLPGSELDPRIAARLKRDPAGLVAAVIQQHDTRQVLMVGWMDDQALHRTLTTGRATYWSRSRQRYWVKGETSGNVQRVVSIALDCDGDALLVQVDQQGPACHTGAASCFDAGGRVDTGAALETGSADSGAADSTGSAESGSATWPAASTGAAASIDPAADGRPERR